ncbi:hypothetical protein [Bremerella sp.]|uniref:hypothetical protein n=1 Tax=Bremerella sp. TaxID=2795602 RepID=UPI00391D36ED
MLRTHAIVLGLLISCGSLGCNFDSGPPMVEVSGTVTFDGQPVNDGNIFFRAKDGGNSYGGKIVQGKYESTVSPGDKTVEIIAMREVPGVFVSHNPGEKSPKMEMFIPPKYNRKTTLEISLPQDASQSTQDFQLDN